MYSIVLMAAMTSTAEPVGFGGLFCGLFCCGGYYHRTGCYGCYSHCAPPVYASCCGCGGAMPVVYGGYPGPLAHGVYGTYLYSMSVPVAPTLPMTTTYPSSNPSTTPPQSGSQPSPSGPLMPPPAGSLEPLPKPSTKSDTSQAPASTGRMVVQVPEDAKLYIDGELMKSKSGRRVFRTPQLEPGQLYYYTVRVEYERDGKPVSEAKRIIVSAGGTVQTVFGEPPAGQPMLAIAR